MEIGNGIRKLETGNGQQMFMLQLIVSLETTCIASSPGSPDLFNARARNIKNWEWPGYEATT